MISLYPIVRRVRRPLLPVDEQAAPAEPAVPLQAETPQVPVTIPETLPAPDVPDVKATRKNEAKRKQA